MKAALIVILLTITGGALGYLAGAFFSASFDIAAWSDSARFLTLMLMAVLAVGGFFIGATAAVLLHTEKEMNP